MSDSILQSFNINEFAGASGLILGALGGLLAVIFKSRCHCKMNLCFLCQCERKPPPDKEVDSSDEESIIPKKTTEVEPEPAPESARNNSTRHKMEDTCSCPLQTLMVWVVAVDVLIAVCYGWKEALNK